MPSTVDRDLRPILVTDDGETLVQGRVHLRLAKVDDVAGGVLFVVEQEQVDRDNLPPYETWLDTEAFSDGPVKTTTVAADEPGQVLADIELLVDNHGPEIDVAQPPAGACADPQIGLWMEAGVEDQVPLHTVEFRVAGVPVATFEGAPYKVFLTPDQIPTPNPGSPIRFTVAAESERGQISNVNVDLWECQP